MEFTRYYMKCTVERVIDGDTIDVTTHLPFNINLTDRRFRINGIDTPECRTLNKLEKKAGLKVKQYLIDLIEGKSVFIISHLEGSPDGEKYGRFLADIFLDEVDPENTISNLLLSLGYAREYHGEKREPWTDEELNKIIAN